MMNSINMSNKVINCIFSTLLCFKPPHQGAPTSQTDGWTDYADRIAMAIAKHDIVTFG